MNSNIYEIELFKSSNLKKKINHFAVCFKPNP